MNNVIRKVLKSVLPAFLYQRISSLFQRLLWQLKYPGKTYSCPFCKYTSGRFIPYTNPYRISIEADIISGQSIDNHHCPNCHSTDRERNLFFYFERHKNLFVGKKILHFAPEKSLYHYLSRAGSAEYICGDITPQNYHHFTKNIQSIDILHIAYPDAYFDLVICNHVLEHIPSDIAAMKEIYRVLKPQGVAILLVPIGAKLEKTLEDSSKETEEQRAEAFGQYDHVRIYAETDYIRRLEASNFKVEISGNGLNGEDIIKYAIDPREKLFVAFKP